MPDVNTVRDLSPIAILCLAVFYGLPVLLRQVGEIGTLIVQGRNDLAVKSLEFAQTSIETASKDRDRIENRMELLAEAVIGMRADLKELSQLVKGLYP